MKGLTPGFWHVDEKNGAIGFFSGDIPVAMVMSQGKNSEDTQRANAYLLAAAPKLLKVCKKLKETLENCLIVTSEGLKVNDSDLRESLLDAILVAEGYRKGSIDNLKLQCKLSLSSQEFFRFHSSQRQLQRLIVQRNGAPSQQFKFQV